MRYSVKLLLRDLWVAWRTHGRELVGGMGVDEPVPFGVRQADAGHQDFCSSLSAG